MFTTALLAGALLTSAGPTITNPYFPLPPGHQWVYREGSSALRSPSPIARS